MAFFSIPATVIIVLWLGILELYTGISSIGYNSEDQDMVV
jgi:hypothetical protein